MGYGERFVHGFGLTEAVLARTRAGAVKPGHKRKLLPLGHDIARLQSAVPWPDRGLYRAAVARGDAPPWVEPNLASLEVIERKIFNRHAWGENLRLALTFPPPVERVAADAGSE